MRRALVIAAHYPTSSGYPNDPHWSVDAELLAARLAQHGYRVERLAADAAFAQLRTQLRQTHPGELCVLYFAGYVVLSNTGEPALLFGGDANQTLSVRALLQRAATQFERALVLLDARAGSVVDSALKVSDDVLAERVLEALEQPNVDLVLRLLPWGKSDTGSTPFHDALGHLAHQAQAATTSELLAALNQHAPQPALHHRTAAEPFVLLQARQYASASSALQAVPTLSIAFSTQVSTLATSSAPTPPESAPSADVPSSSSPASDSPSGPRSQPPPKPTARPLSQRPPPKPNPERAAFEEPAPIIFSGPLNPLPIQTLEAPLAPPPSAPELAPPPPSWFFAGDPPPPPQEVCNTEDELAAALQRHTGEEHRETRLHLLETFLEQQPSSTIALQHLSQELADSQQWERLSTHYQQLITKQTARSVALQLCLAHARLCSNQLHNPRRALPSIERATELDPQDYELKLEASALYEQLGETLAAKAHLLRAVQIAPLSAAVQHRAGAFFAGRRELERSFQAAAILHYLGAAGAAEQALYAQGERGALPKASRALQAEDWMLGLEPGAKDPGLTSLLELVSDIALAWVKPKRQELIELRSQLQLEDAANSTTMLARALVWTCRLLSVPIPVLYLASGSALPKPLPILEPAWVVGREVGRGATQAELTFQWARSLSRNTGTARVLRLFSDENALQLLLTACFIATRNPAPAQSQASVDLALTLRQSLSAEALSSLTSLIQKSSFEEWRERLFTFLDQVGFCSNRTALLAAGDPALAGQSLRELGYSEAQIHQQLSDLFCFALSDEYHDLRRRLGVPLTA